MKMFEVSNSTMISRITYNDGELVVYFVRGSNVSYSNVPESVYEDFINAPSIGKYYHANIKGKY